jgi:hypothetical protein
MSEASLLDAVMRVGSCVSLMLRVRERCYGSKSASDLWTFARCVSFERVHRAMYESAIVTRRR